MMPRKPESDPSANAEIADLTGILKTRQATNSAAMTPWKAAFGSGVHYAIVNDFAGRVAIITGAWRGLGRAAAERLHERGAAVAVNVRDAERAESLAQSIGERALAVPGDIAAPGVPEEIV